MTTAKRHTLAEAAHQLGLADMSVLYYVRYSKALPTHIDEQGNLYLLGSDIEQYRAQHQQKEYQRGRLRSRRQEA